MTEPNELIEQVTTLATDYAAYISLETHSEKRDLDESIDVFYTRLEEFISFLCQLREQNEYNLSILSEIVKYDEIENLFVKIENLSKYVKMMGKSLNQMEIALNKAEEHFTDNLKKRVLSSISFNKKKKYVPPPRYTPPEIPKLSDLAIKDDYD